MNPNHPANANPEGSCQHGRVGPCTICECDAEDAR